MNDRRRTPTIEIAIGRELRLYHAYVTTAPAKLDAPATLTVDAGPLWEISGMAEAPIAFDAARAQVPTRLVLVDGSQLDGKRRSTRKRSTSSSQPTRCSLD